MTDSPHDEIRPRRRPGALGSYNGARDKRGRFLPGGLGPGRAPGIPQPGLVWRNAMFRAWIHGGLSAAGVQLAWLKGEAISLEDGSVINFGDPNLSTAERWLQLQKLFVQLAPKEVAVSGEIDPEARAAAIARDQGIAAVMETLFEELDERAARRRG